MPACGTIRYATSTGSPISAQERRGGLAVRDCAPAVDQVGVVTEAELDKVGVAIIENTDLSDAPTRATLRGRNKVVSRSPVIWTGICGSSREVTGGMACASWLARGFTGAGRTARIN